jgi:hypothetical protein
MHLHGIDALAQGSSDWPKAAEPSNSWRTGKGLSNSS